MEITTTYPTTAAAPRIGVPSRVRVMRDQWLVPTCNATHNSISTALPTLVVDTTNGRPAGNASFTAFKQAAPPRGVPR
jgi:hypothetical protein